MTMYVQYAIVAVLTAAALWVSWRKLRGRYVLKGGRKPDDSASCASAREHRH